MANWVETIYLSDIWKNERLTFEERRDRIVERIKASRWYRNRDDAGFDDLGELIQDLSDAPDQTEFDEFWGVLYDQADYDRIWIDLVSPAPSWLAGV